MLLLLLLVELVGLVLVVGMGSQVPTIDSNSLHHHLLLHDLLLLLVQLKRCEGGALPCSGSSLAFVDGTSCIGSVDTLGLLL